MPDIYILVRRFILFLRERVRERERPMMVRVGRYPLCCNYRWGCERPHQGPGNETWVLSVVMISYYIAVSMTRTVSHICSDDDGSG